MRPGALAIAALVVALPACDHPEPGPAAGEQAAAASRALRSGDFAKAKEHARRALDRKPGVVEHRIALAMAEAALGNEARARRHYRKAEAALGRAEGPDGVDDHAMVLALLGHPERAKRVLKQGAESFPDDKPLGSLAADADPFIHDLRKGRFALPRPSSATPREAATSE